MELQSADPLSKDDVYQLAVPDGSGIERGRLGMPAEPFEGQVALEGGRQEVSAATMEVAPMVVGLERANGSTAARIAEPSSMPRDGSSAGEPSAPSEPSSVPKTPATAKAARLRPRKRRRKVRLMYLMQAWSVSLAVHVAILSAPGRRHVRAGGHAQEDHPA